MTDADIAALDAEDPLAPFRERFVLPDNLIYLDGNSLGPAPKAAFDDLKRVIEKEWAEGLIASWNNAGWFASPKALGDRLRKILGAVAAQNWKEERDCESRERP